jgi:ribonuclease P/MRP protein subunit POP5
MGTNITRTLSLSIVIFDGDSRPDTVSKTARLGRSTVVSTDSSDRRRTYYLWKQRSVVKHLPKHIRPRWRYLAVGIETWPDTTVERETFQRALWYSAQNLLGDPGSAALDLSVLRFRGERGVWEALVRTRRGELDRARAVLCCVDSVGGDPVGLRVLGASGTVRACEEKYMGGRREDYEERDVAFEDADRSAVVRGERADVRVESGFVGATALETE